MGQMGEMGIQRLSTDGKPDADREEPRNPRLDLSVAQVAGSAVAAVVAAVLASQLGVYGTIIGAGVVSVVATSGGTIFQHLFRRTGEQIREVTVHAKPKARQGPARVTAAEDVPRTRVLRTVALPADLPDGRFNEATTHGTRVRGWKRSLLAALVVFVVAMAGITAYELLSGGDLSGGRGSTVGNVLRGGDQHREKTPPSRAPDPRTPDSGSSSPGAGTTTPDGRSPGPGRGAGEAGTTPAPGRTPPKTPDDAETTGGTTGPATPAPTPTPSAGGGAAAGDSGQAPETGGPDDAPPATTAPDTTPAP
ncbi:hypothetical protein GCM10010346_43810 [Streptomyces chryseus]|uniref:Uncharacterized protein n=2 Tax=Streptomyces chryseus TaxID=68186 RepID=A0ABQ3DT91_9ACTN|nr:hypothetical protein GCM10010346_43810 [Streptomyces chryseus]